MAVTPGAPTEELFFGTQATTVLIPYNHALDSVVKKEDDFEYDEVGGNGPKANPFMGDGSKKRVAVEEIMPNKRHKRFKMNARVEGGYAPSFKPITVDLDEEDQMIVDMKQKGYNDLTIAQRLRAQGFTKYEPGSVSCRWLRIRKKTQEYEEKLLDEELTDWHVGEDELLEEAEAAAEEKYKVELEKLERKRWTWTAQNLNRRLARARYSAKACKERSEAKANGTARCPPESDPDPEGRARERQERIAAFKQRKRDEAEQAAAAAEAKKKSKKNDTPAKIEARARKAAQDAIRAQKKKEQEDYRQNKVTTATVARERKKSAVNMARDLRLYEETKHKFFTKLHKQLAKEVAAILRKKERNGGITPEPEGTKPGYKPKSRYAFKNTEEENRNEDYASAEAALEARAELFSGVVQAVGTVSEQAASLTKPSGADDGETATSIFPDEPREMCTIDELHDILRARGMLLNRMKENKSVIISRLNTEDESIGIQELRDLLQVRKEDTSGTRAELMRRLSIADAMSSRKYQSKYANRPLDEDGNRTKVKMPVKAGTGKSTKRYCARDVSIKNGKAVTTPSAPATKRKPAATKAPAKKTPAKGKKQSEATPKPLMPEDDNEDDSEDFPAPKKLNEDKKKVVKAVKKPEIPKSDDLEENDMESMMNDMLANAGIQL
ncbi:hypothetical protein D6D25_04240 [Aureobasidium pullulans]|nr:hypothetical protein D6D25_04240 [Aureobasidium pullulans]